MTFGDPRWPPWCFATSPTSIHKIRSSRCGQILKKLENLQSANFPGILCKFFLEARTSRFFPVYDLLVHCKFTTSAMSFLAAYDAYDLHTFPPSPSRVKQKSLKIWASQESIIEIRLFCCPCGPCHVRRLMIWDLLAPLISSTSRCLSIKARVALLYHISCKN